MKHIKRTLCVLLLAMTLFGAFSVAVQAAPASVLDSLVATYSRSFQKELEKILRLETVTEKDLKPIAALLGIVQGLGIDVDKFLRNMDIPIAAKKVLHAAGIKFPLYERSYFWHFIFKYLLFGWIWM